MNYFKADFYMFQHVLEGMDIADLCEEIFTNEECPENRTFKRKDGSRTEKVTFCFVPIYERNEDGCFTGSPQGWVYVGCVYEEITVTKRVKTSYHEDLV